LETTPLNRTKPKTKSPILIAGKLDFKCFNSGDLSGHKAILEILQIGSSQARFKKETFICEGSLSTVFGTRLCGEAQRVASNAPGLSQQSNRSIFNGSRFGPSRLADSQFSNTNLPANLNYYGGVPFSNRQSGNSNFNGNSPQQFSVGSNRQQNPQFSLAGYGGQSSQNGNVGQGNRLSPVTLGRGGSRFFKPADWMPWGFLAIGTLVMLYTNSVGRGFPRE